MLHRTRNLLVRQRTMLANAIRSHLAEFGIVAVQGVSNVVALIERLILAPKQDEPLPDLVPLLLALLLATMNELRQRIKMLEVEIMKLHRANEMSRRLETIPGFGYITSTAIAAAVSDPSMFRSGREFAAWLGLTPRQNSSGGRERLAASRRWVIAISAASLSMGQRPSSALRKKRDRRRRYGLGPCWRRNPHGSWPSRSPTKWRGSLGR